MNTPKIEAFAAAVAARTPGGDNIHLTATEASELMAELRQVIQIMDEFEVKPGNPPAFPSERGKGMSLRAYLAGQALAGLCANPTLVGGHGAENDFGKVASMALGLADTLRTTGRNTKQP